jgi:hypothetical protein
MIFNSTFESNSLQQFQKLWGKIATLNIHITLVNKEIEIVKSHLQELIGIDVSNLATFGDLSNLENNLKHYTDAVFDSVDLFDYVVKDELLDLLICVPKSEMYYEGDPTKDVRIKYNAPSTSSFDHKNNIYIGGSYNGITYNSDYQNIVIGHGVQSKNYGSVIIGCDASSDSALITAIGYSTKSNMYSTAIGQNSQANGTYSIAIGRNAQATNSYGIAIGINCINTNSQYIKF